MDFFYCGTSPANEGLWNEILPTLISSGLLILLFIATRYLDSTVRLEEVRQNWYLKVIIDPNISRFEKFYKDTILALRSSINVLVPYKTPEFFPNYGNQKSIEMGKFQELKRKFEMEFISLVQINYPMIANELTDQLRDLEDDIIGCLDNNSLKLTDADLMEEKINTNRHYLLAILYKPLVIRRTWLLPQIKNWFGI